MKHLQFHCPQVVVQDRSIVVEEFGVAPNLLQVRLAEGLLEDDVEESHANLGLVAHEVAADQSLDLSRLVNYDLAWLAFVGSLVSDGVCDGVHGEHHAARDGVGAQHLEIVPVLFLKNLDHQRGVKDFIWNNSQSVLVHEHVVQKVDFEVV